jgi:signal peptidase
MKNPLSLSLLNIIVNFIQIILAKFIFESIRFNLIKINKSNIFCILATLAFALFYVNFATILSFTSYGAIFKYICRYVIPIIALGSISTYIAKNGSFVSLLIIQLVPSFVSTYIKYQPDLNFFLSGLIAIIFAMTFYLITKYQIDLKNTDLKRSNIKRNNPLTYIPYFIVFGIIVCFVIGLFSYVPVAVMSNSMYPVYQRGDVIIYKKINNPSNLKVGDIVCYKLNNILVMHRIAKIEKTNCKLLFTTKGDNLDHNDVKKVTERQIVGIIKKIVPKCGYPSVWFYEFLSK